MKKMKKLISVLLTLVMVIAMAAPAFAMEGAPVSAETYTITITSDVTGHTYEAYQVFTGRVENVEGKQILSDIDWGEGVNGPAILAKLIGLNDSPYAKCTTAADVAMVLNGMTFDAQGAKEFADIVGQHLETSSATSDYADGVYTISNLEAGYYFVKDQEGSVSGDDAYTRFILEVVGNATAAPKASVPTVDKEVFEESVEGWNEVADYDINDKVPFRLTGTMPSTLDDYETYYYAFHDTFSAGLTYDTGSAKVYLVNGEDNQVDVSDRFTINSAGNTLTVSIENVKSIGGVVPGSKIVVEYTATLNSNAEIGKPGNENSVNLEFSNNPNGEGKGITPDDKVVVFTYELDVTKQEGTDGDTTAATKLPGAEFKLYKKVTVEGSDVDKFAIVDENGKITGWADTQDDGSTLTSDANGLFKITGLDDGIYYLREIKAPVGYNMLKKDVELTINATTNNVAGDNTYVDSTSNVLTGLTIQIKEEETYGDPSNGDLENGSVEAIVTNNKGAALPETGGIGTTIFYIVGAILVIGAGVVLVTRKKMSHHE